MAEIKLNKKIVAGVIFGVLATPFAIHILPILETWIEAFLSTLH